MLFILHKLHALITVGAFLSFSSFVYILQLRCDMLLTRKAVGELGLDCWKIKGQSPSDSLIRIFAFFDHFSVTLQIV